jgi:hypothetical protein
MYSVTMQIPVAPEPPRAVALAAIWLTMPPEPPPPLFAEAAC